MNYMYEYIVHKCPEYAREQEDEEEEEEEVVIGDEHIQEKLSNVKLDGLLRVYVRVLCHKFSPTGAHEKFV
jgi:hypothetical protein